MYIGTEIHLPLLVVLAIGHKDFLREFRSHPLNLRHFLLVIYAPIHYYLYGYPAWQNSNQNLYPRWAFTTPPPNNRHHSSTTKKSGNQPRSTTTGIKCFVGQYTVIGGTLFFLPSSFRLFFFFSLITLINSTHVK